MTQSSRSMSLWNNPDSSLGITGFKDRLKILIGKNSVRSFASECGISDATIRKYLSGQSLPGIDKIEAIVKYTGCSLEWLVTGKVLSNLHHPIMSHRKKLKRVGTTSLSH